MNISQLTGGPSTRSRPFRSYFITAVIIVGAGMLMLGALIAKTPPMRQQGILTGVFGFLIASIGAVFRARIASAPLESRSRLLSGFLIFSSTLFAAMMLWSSAAGVLNLYQCAQFCARERLSLSETIYQSLVTTSTLSGQAAMRSQDVCFVGFVEVILAAACAVSLLSAFRDLKKDR